MAQTKTEKRRKALEYTENRVAQLDDRIASGRGADTMTTSSGEKITVSQKRSRVARDLTNLRTKLEYAGRY
jgi:hypothetical protein